MHETLPIAKAQSLVGREQTTSPCSRPVKQGDKATTKDKHSVKKGKPFKREESSKDLGPLEINTGSEKIWYRADDDCWTVEKRLIQDHHRS